MFRSGRHKGLSLSPPLCVGGRLFLESAQRFEVITTSVPRRSVSTFLCCAISRATMGEGKTRTGTHLRGAIGGKRTGALRADGTERRAGVGERALSEELAELRATLGETTPSPRPACATTNKTDRERFRTVCVPLGAAQKLEFITALCVSRKSVPLCGAEA